MRTVSQHQRGTNGSAAEERLSCRCGRDVIVFATYVGDTGANLKEHDGSRNFSTRKRVVKESDSTSSGLASS